MPNSYHKISYTAIIIMLYSGTFATKAAYASLYVTEIRYLIGYLT